MTHHSRRILSLILNKLFGPSPAVKAADDRLSVAAEKLHGTKVAKRAAQIVIAAATTAAGSSVSR